MPKKGYKATKEHRLKLRESHLGKKITKEHRLKLRESHLGKKLTKKTKNRISISQKGFHNSPSTEFKKGHKGMFGNKNPSWRGGRTSVNAKIRNSKEYKLWRISVFERDNYTCIWCGQVGGKLHADHIKPFSQYPELRLAIDNGRTLCIKCHKTTDTYLNYRFKKQ